MAGTYSRIYLHFVFAVQGRQSLIPKSHQEELHKYMTALVEARGAKMLAVYCMPDHMHLLAGVKPSIYSPNMVKELKVQRNGLKAHFTGRKVMAFSLTAFHKLTVFATIYSTRRSIIKRKHSKRSIMTFWKNSKCRMKKNICLVG